MSTLEDHVEITARFRDGARALGDAMSSVKIYVEPAVARAVQAEHNLVARIEAEFGLYTSAQVGKMLGSRSSAPRNLAASTHREGATIALHRGTHLTYPGFQFGPDGQPLPVIRQLRDLAESNDWTETGLIQWLCAPTTYLDGKRPVDVIATNPDRLVAVARDALTVSW